MMSYVMLSHVFALGNGSIGFKIRFEIRFKIVSLAIPFTAVFVFLSGNVREPSFQSFWIHHVLVNAQLGSGSVAGPWKREPASCSHAGSPVQAACRDVPRPKLLCFSWWEILRRRMKNAFINAFNASIDPDLFLPTVYLILHASLLFHVQINGAFMFFLHSLISHSPHAPHPFMNIRSFSYSIVPWQWFRTLDINIQKWVPDVPGYIHKYR